MSEYEEYERDKAVFEEGYCWGMIHLIIFEVVVVLAIWGVWRWVK